MDSHEHSLRMAIIRTEAYRQEGELEILHLTKQLNSLSKPDKYTVKKLNLKLAKKRLEVDEWEVELEEMREKLKRYN